MRKKKPRNHPENRDRRKRLKFKRQLRSSIQYGAKTALGRKRTSRDVTKIPREDGDYAVNYESGVYALARPGRGKHLVYFRRDSKFKPLAEATLNELMLLRNSPWTLKSEAPPLIQLALTMEDE